MRCGRCGKNFDEEMYSGICPKCGHFNNKQTEHDVSKYFSAKFEEPEKTSTSAQAAKQHADLHKMYDKYNMHKPGAQQAKTYQAGGGQHTHQAGTQGFHQQGSMLAKANPYQQENMQAKANPYQQASGQTEKLSGAYPQRTVQENTYQTGQTGSYQQGNAGQYDHAKLNGAEKERNIVPVICGAIAIAAIIATIIACNIKRMQVARIYETVDYEQEFAETGEIFEVNDRLLVVEKAEIVDTSMLEGISKEDNLITVTVGILPTEEWSRRWGSETVYLSDGLTCRQCLDSYTLGDILVKKESESGDYYVEEDNVLEQLYDLGEFDGEEILTGYNYLDYDSADGKTGKFFFLMDKDAGIVEISFDQEIEKDGVYVLEKRVSIPLIIEEGAR